MDLTRNLIQRINVIVADELPKTSTSKIQKNVVRDTHTAHDQS